MYFALDSQSWGGGGMAFLDLDRPGRMPGRAYLMTFEQFCDVTAQELDQAPGSLVLDLAALCRAGRHTLGPEFYGSTVFTAGEIDGIPVVGFTAATRLSPIQAPSPAYLSVIAEGLAEAFGWTAREALDHLVTCPGADLIDPAAVVDLAEALTVKPTSG